MANQNTAAGGARAKKEPKLLLASLFVDADVTVEPVEPPKVVVAGMTEAVVPKEYPDSYIKRAAAVLRGEMSMLFKMSLYFIAATLVFALVYFVGLPFIKELILSDTYNFMAQVGVGYPGGGDSVAESVARLYWDVDLPILAMLAGAGIIASLFMAGHFYCAKRSYFQNNYKRITRTFFIGVKQYWWKFMLTAAVGIAIAFAMGTAMLYHLQQVQLGTAGAGSVCAVVFSFIFGAPLLTVPMVMLALIPTYSLSYKDVFKNALVLIANNPISVILVGAFSAAPLLLLLINTVVSVVVYLAMVVAGFNFVALCWIAMAHRGMTKCKALKSYVERRASGPVRAQKPTYTQSSEAKPKKKPRQKQPYQNPKKKKKK